MDGIYGYDTQTAVRAFQRQRVSMETGIVDDGTWAALTGSPIPGLNERALGLTAAFEGHNYTLAVGNFDGAWLTWGIIGFTMFNGEVQRIVNAIDETDSTLIDRAFGPNAAEFRQIMRDTMASRKSWALGQTLPGGMLAEPWRSAFAALGGFPAVQAEQRRRAFDDYYTPAIKTAGRFQLAAELGMALAFDIHVQNGGIGDETTAEIQKRLAVIENPAEQQRREIIANAVADHARAEYRENVRSRKLAIARGAGIVAGRQYQLDNWGLAELAAAASL